MKKILLLDDCLDILQIVEEILVTEQYNVKTANRYAGFLTLAEQFHPDLMILDYCLHDGNGGELCRLVKHHPTLYNVPVILFSAYSKLGLNLADFGCDEVIAKPFNIDHLLANIKRLIDEPHAAKLPAQSF